MDWFDKTLFCTLLCLLFGESSIRFGAYASTLVTGEDTFTIQHEGTGKCLQVQHGSLMLGGCSEEPASLWKWGSGHRLFHMGLYACLVMDVPSKTLSLTSCSAGLMFEWHCSEASIYTVYHMRLSATTNGTVLAKRDASDSWVRGGTSENICQQPYRIMHTSGGNANGAPCEFPFLYNGTWHHSCLPSDSTHPHDWCSTEANYDQDQMWGNCLKYEEGCGALWNISMNGRCYQVVSSALVTWHEARDACRSQGGDLLSVSRPEELRGFKAGTDLPEKAWFGLNHLDWVQGWQWSDGSPLSYVPWDKDSLASKSIMVPSDCGVLNPSMLFSSETCEMKLPYICEKKENITQTEAADKVMYKPTECESGWVPWRGFCYKLYGTDKGTQQTYAAAQQVCVRDGAQLASIHSLEDVEMLSTQFNGEMLNGWIGLKAASNKDLYKWEDGTDVSFTYWGRTQPPLLAPNTDSCVTSLEADHVWFVVSCNTSKPFLCKKNGTVNESAPEEGCPQDGDWRRHGNVCYKIDLQEVSYKNSCKLTINDRFEQTFINSLLKAHVGEKPLYFWTGLQDSKGTGEYQWFSQTEQRDKVTYTNWRWQEPANVGGCAVLSTTVPLGQWSVKNCTVFKAGSICKKQISAAPPVPTPAEPDVNATCPSGWVSSKGNKYCYKVFHEERLSRKRTWEEAERFCEALGAHLPSFTEMEEMNELHKILRNSISDDRFFWIGLNRRNPNTGNSWEWSDRRPVSMAIFPQEFHEDDDYNRDCAAFKSLKGNFKPFFFFFLLHDLPEHPFYSRAFHCDAKLEWVCQIPRGQAPKNPEWYNPDGHHSTSLFIDSQEFWFVTQPQLSFEEATLYCSSNNSKLATPQTINAARHLQELLLKHTGSKNMNWWMNLLHTGPLVPIRFSRLHLYHSQFLGRCTSIRPDSFMPDYQINCDSKQPFVCETLNVTSAETGTQDPHPPGQPCEDGTLAFRDKCYKVIKPQFLSFKKANEVCLSLRGTLLSIRDQAEQDFITTLLPGQPQKLWIGLKLRLHDTQWMDNQPVTYLNFNPLLHGQLRPMFINTFEQDGLELCAYMYNDAHSDMLGTWDYTSCTDGQSVTICQHYTNEPEASVVPKGEFQVNNHTFKVVIREDVNWFDAWEMCKKNNMDLASVADAYVQAVLTVNVSKLGSPLWIGLFSQDEEHYHWTDHSHTVFSRWGPEATAGPCVYLDTDGYWKATECGKQLKGAICHIPQEENSPPSQDADTRKCPHKSNGANWIPFRNNCYTFLLESGRWQEHDKNKDQQTCQNIVGMGDLLTIRNEEENVFIKEQLQPFRNLANFVWLGMYKYEKDHRMKWYDGTNVQYSKWKNGRPNVAEPFMAGLNLDGEWELIHTSVFKRFKQRAIVVCKIESGSKQEFQMSPDDVLAPVGYNFHLITKKLNWYQALEECSSGGGHLVSIHNETANSNMSLIAKRDGYPLWIGLSRQDYSGWPYEWSDGTSWQFQPQGFEVAGSGSEEKCVYVDANGSWSTVNCHAELEGAICYSSQSSSRISSQSSANCPKSDGQASWIQFENHCYAIDMILYNYSVYTMEDAKSICEKLDPASQLLTIKSKEENDFVSRHVSENPLITSRVWLGLDSVKASGWMDGSAIDFSNWGYIQNKSGCAVLVSMNGTWSHASCTESRSRVICKTPAKSVGAPVAVVFFVIVLLCLAAVVVFIIYKRNRHRFSSTVRYQRNFDEADSTSIISETE